VADLELYVGIENLFDFRQNDPIIDPGNPSGPYFDASLIWGPLMGRSAYGGMRYRF
jgi:outer membrane receptor protein involved in Fe transport